MARSLRFPCSRHSRHEQHHRNKGVAKSEQPTRSLHVAIVANLLRAFALVGMFDGDGTQGVAPVTVSLRARGTGDGEAYVVKGFNVSAFFEVVAEVVAARNTNWKLLAKEVGVSPSTLSRRGRGRCPDAATLAALSAWAGLNPADFVVASKRRTAANPLAAISGVLRSDPDLAPNAVQALETIIRVAYASMERSRRTSVRAGRGSEPLAELQGS